MGGIANLLIQNETIAERNGKKKKRETVVGHDKASANLSKCINHNTPRNSYRLRLA